MWKEVNDYRVHFGDKNLQIYLYGGKGKRRMRDEAPTKTGKARRSADLRRWRSGFFPC